MALDAGDVSELIIRGHDCDKLGLSTARVRWMAGTLLTGGEWGPIPHSVLEKLNGEQSTFCNAFQGLETNEGQYGM